MNKSILLADFLHSPKKNPDLPKRLFKNTCPICKKSKPILIESEWSDIVKHGLSFQESRFLDYGNTFLLCEVNPKYTIGFWGDSRFPDEIVELEFQPGELKNIICKACTELELLLPSE